MMSDKKLRDILSIVAKGIDWDQQDASRYYIGEDAAETVLLFLDFPHENGISNEAIDAYLNSPQVTNEEK